MSEVRIPSQYAVDYGAVMSAALEQGGTSLGACLREHLVHKWHDVYVANVAHPSNIVRFKLRGFEYLCDIYSDLEATGEVPFNQTVKDRVVAVIGTSECAGTIGTEPPEAIGLQQAKRFSAQKETGVTLWHTPSEKDSI